MREINVIGFAWEDGRHSPKLEMVPVTAMNRHLCGIENQPREIFQNMTLDTRSVRMLADGADMIARGHNVRETCDVMFGFSGAYAQNLESIGRAFRVYGHVLRQLGIHNEIRMTEENFRDMLGQSLIEASDSVDLESLAGIIEWAVRCPMSNCSDDPARETANQFRKACGLPITGNEQDENIT